MSTQVCNQLVPSRLPSGGMTTCCKALPCLDHVEDAAQRELERKLYRLATKDPTVEIRIHSEGWMKEIQVSEPGIDTLQRFTATDEDGGIRRCIEIAHEVMCPAAFGGDDGE